MGLPTANTISFKSIMKNIYTIRNTCVDYVSNESSLCMLIKRKTKTLLTTQRYRLAAKIMSRLMSLIPSLNLFSNSVFPILFDACTIWRSNSSNRLIQRMMLPIICFIQKFLNHWNKWTCNIEITFEKISHLANVTKWSATTPGRDKVHHVRLEFLYIFVFFKF